MRILSALFSILSSVTVIVVNLVLLANLAYLLVSVAMANQEYEHLVAVAGWESLLVVAASIAASLLGLTLVNKLVNTAPTDA